MLVDRRRALLALTSLALAACRRSSTSSERGGPAPVVGEGWKDITFDPDPDIPDGQRALLYAPPGSRGLPLLVALHGRGESGRGLEVGAHAWRDDYYIDRILQRLAAPPLTIADLQKTASKPRLDLLNRSLEANPFKGICLACPYTPDLPDKSAAGAAAYGRFITEKLLPRARAETGASADRAATGIDGVSMGGRLSLLVGLTRTDVFGAVGALQPAMRANEAAMFSELARAGMAKASSLLRLVSSEADPFLPAVRAVSERLRADGVVHELLVVPGNHDYDWNRGPGGVEMTLWHERVLRGLKAP
jgi:acetyl esterase/lipase